MSRLIDADALMEALGITDMDCGKCKWGDRGWCTRGSEFEDACLAIEDAPTVDAVPTEFHDKCLQIEIQKRFNDAVYKDFAEWVAKWVVSENFQEEANAFAELACRRLVLLDVMEKKDGYYMMKTADEVEDE